MQRDDAEREVERGRHLAVRDGGERRRVQHALQPRQLAGHRPVSLSPPQEVQPSAAEREEEDAEEIARRTAPRRGCLDQERDPEHDREEPEHEHRALVEAHAARSRGVATMTRHGA